MELRAQAEAAERLEKGSDELEDEEEDDEEEEDDGEPSGEAEEPGGDGEDEGEEEAPKKRKPAAKPKPKPRSRAAKVVRMKVVWGVFNNSNQRVAVYDYPKRKEAEEHAAKLMTDKKSTFFVQPVKEPIEEKKDS
jgi:cobalamin biosynthesis protein CobT